MRTLTTGQVAKMCGFSKAKVNKWIDSGLLDGFRVPGSRHRRVTVSSVEKFREENRIPVVLDQKETDALLGQACILLVTQDQQLIDDFRRLDWVTTERAWRIETAASSYAAGGKVASVGPQMVIVDFAIGSAEALGICQVLSDQRRFPGVIVMALAVSETQGRQLASELNRAVEIWQRPFDPELLLTRLESKLARI